MSGIDYLKKFLVEEGIHFKELTDISMFFFKYQDFKFSAKENVILTRILPLCLDIEVYEKNSEYRRLVLEACNEVNITSLSKIIVINDNTVRIYYTFIPNSATTNQEIFDALDDILDARETFLGMLEEIEKM